MIIECAFGRKHRRGSEVRRYCPPRDRRSKPAGPPCRLGIPSVGNVARSLRNAAPHTKSMPPPDGIADMSEEPIYDIAHLGHLELLTPRPDESLRFFVDVMGMTESGRAGDSVYLRGWDDYERYSSSSRARTPRHGPHGLPHPQPAGAGAARPGPRRVRLRCRLERRRSRPGPDLPCAATPTAIAIELYYETEWYEAPPELQPALKNQAQKFPARGVNVRRLDHLNCLAADVRANRVFFESYLGFRLTEQIVLDDGTEAGMWMTATNKSYDFAYTLDRTASRGRFHHLTYARRQPRGHAARGRHLPRERRLHRNRAAQARGAADLLPLCLRTRRQSRRDRQCRRTAHARARLEADRLERGRTPEGPGLGAEDDRIFHTYGTPPV